MPSFANIHSVQSVYQSPQLYCMLPVVHEEVLLTWYAAFKQFLERSDVDDPARIRNADETGCLLCPKSGKVLTLAGTSTRLPQIQRNRLLLGVQFLLQGMLFQHCTYFQATDFGITHLRVVSVELTCTCTLANLKRITTQLFHGRVAIH